MLSVWTPLQRLFQLNQALSLTEHYKDEDYWERIIFEFFEVDARITLSLGEEKSFSFPPFVISKLFWVWAQLGLEALQFAWFRLDESLNEDGSVSVASHSCSINSYHLSRSLHLSQTCQKTIRFSFTSKISELHLAVTDYKAFGSNSKNALKFGFDDALVTFMDVASVMSAVLPDYSSWLTWFTSYCQQYGYVNSSSLAAYASQLKTQSHISLPANEMSYSVDVPELDPPPEIFGVELDNLPNESVDQAEIESPMDDLSKITPHDTFVDGCFEPEIGHENSFTQFDIERELSDYCSPELNHEIDANVDEISQVEYNDSNVDETSDPSDNAEEIEREIQTNRPIEEEDDDFFSSYMD